MLLHLRSPQLFFQLSNALLGLVIGLLKPLVACQLFTAVGVKTDGPIVSHAQQEAQIVDGDAALGIELDRLISVALPAIGLEPARTAFHLLIDDDVEWHVRL